MIYRLVPSPSRFENRQYKPLESTLSDEKLFIEIVFAEDLSRPNA